MGLLDVFRAGLPEARRAAVTAELEPRLRRMIDEARAAWPGIEQSETAYLERVAARLPEAESIEGALDAIVTRDLWLAGPCAAGEAKALALFEKTYLREVDIAAAKAKAGAGVADEAKQIVRTILFVGAGTRGPAIADYGGRGDLRGWVRVIAMREVLRLVGKGKREVGVEDEALFDVLSVDEDPELDYLKEMYRTEFKGALREGVEALEARERNLLRHSILDGLSIDEIGAIYRVHRATAARWVAKARETLLGKTRRALLNRLKVSPDELDSLIRMIRSRLDISIPSGLEKE